MSRSLTDFSFLFFGKTFSAPRIFGASCVKGTGVFLWIKIIILRSETENLRRGDVKTGTMVEVNDEMEKMNNNFMCFPL